MRFWMASGTSSACRIRRGCVRILALLALSATVTATLPRAAAAFDFFGLFSNEKSTDTDASVPEPTPYTVSLSAGGGELQDKFEENSILIGEQQKVPSGTIGLLKRAQSDQARLIATLYQEGYYGGTVSVLIGGRSYDAIPVDENLRAAGVVAVTINIEPGPVFTFGDVRVSGVNATPDQLLALGLTRGERARSGTILQAERALIDGWKSRGHPLAKAAGRKISANHATNTVDVALTIEPGPVANFGAVNVVGAEDVDVGFIIAQADVPAGAPYDPALLRRAEKRLRELELFDSISVTEADTLAADGRVPITITLAERKPRVIGAGITASNTDGVGLEAYWVHRNYFGSGENVRLEGGVSRIGAGSKFEDYDLHSAILFSKPGVFGPATDFKSKLAVDQEHPDAFRKRAVSGEIGLSHDFSDTLTGSAGLEAEYSNIRDVTGADNFLLIGTPFELVYDTRDSRLDPTQGIHASAFAEPLHDVENGNSFVITKASIASYWSVDDDSRIVVAGRAAAGSILGAEIAEIPADRRFYAGGGGSIRGYAFQAASPRAADGRLLGGRSFAEASLEARVKVTETIGIVPFIDFGGAFSDELPGDGGEWFSGAGVGLRYMTPVGPLRLDVAAPLKKIDGEPDFGFYVGIGQAF